MMANTSIMGLAVPLAPVTLLFGAPATFIICLVLSLAGTASAWYWLLSRHVVDSRLAAFVGAGFCGFGPGMIAQAGGHPNLTAQFLVPLIIWRVIRLREPGRELRNGIVLGLLTALHTSRRPNLVVRRFDRDPLDMATRCCPPSRPGWR